MPFNPNELYANAYWIVLAPLISGALIILLPFVRQEKTKWISMVLSVGAVLFGFVYSILLLNAFLTTPYLSHAGVNDYTFFQSGLVKFAIGVLVDNLSVMMLIVVTAVSLLVQVYTHGYMREDPGYCRFYAYLSLFTFSMLGLVVATNLFQMYFFWELVGVCSYFLIGFWFYKESAARACLKAFIMNRIGDFGFLMGLLMLFGATRSYWNNGGAPVTILSFAGTPGYTLAEILPKALGNNDLTYGMGFAFTNLALISILIFFGPMAKSAQWPLHSWLPDAMEGPTPISALIHAATMVAAGVYLVARAYPIWQVVPQGVTENIGLGFIAIISTFTAFMAATIALSQFDIKRGLAWSTVSQLGYMFAGLAAGSFTGGMFHLFNHAFFKAMLFLCSGAVIHGLHGEQDMRQMGGLRKHMFGTAACFLIGCLSISGCPFFSGFFSKDDIIGAAWHYNPIMGGTLILTAGLTAFYMFRMYFMTFEGEYRGHATPHNSPPVMVYPLIALAIPSVFSGYLGVPTGRLFQWMAGMVEAPNPFGNFVYYAHKHFEAAEPMMMFAGFAFAACGAGLAFSIYLTRSMDLNTKIVNSTNPVLRVCYDWSFNKWHWDDYYYAFVDWLLAVYRKVWKAIDMLLIDQVVNLTAFATDTGGQLLKYTENGRAQSYALVIFGCVAVLTVVAFMMGK